MGVSGVEKICTSELFWSLNRKGHHICCRSLAQSLGILGVGVNRSGLALFIKQKYLLPYTSKKYSLYEKGPAFEKQRAPARNTAGKNSEFGSNFEKGSDPTLK